MPTDRGQYSYANILEKRVITRTWSDAFGSRSQRKLTFQRMYANPQDRWRSLVIGHEMVAYNSPRVRWRAPVGAYEWIFRAYDDGTALYKPRLLRTYVRGYYACDAVDKVIAQHYYVDMTTNDDDFYHRIQVLRRKPLSSYARMAAQHEGNLGDFLARKYNLGGERETVSC